MSKNLFENDSDSDTEGYKLKTNKDYANSYNKFRSKELLKKLKDKNQDDTDSESDSDSTDDSEIVENSRFNQAFFKTLASLKSKDPSVYNENITFFDDIDPNEKQSEQKSVKPMTVKDYERKILLEKGGIYEEDEKDGKRPQSPSYVDQQKSLKNEIKSIVQHSDSENEDENWGGIFQKRVKTNDEEAADEADYAKWLVGEQTNIGDNVKTMKSLKEYWTNPKLSKDEAFLRDYILNNGYSNRNDDEVPTYDDIVGSQNDIELSEDEAELEKQAEFEHKFNFRFEEPDQEFIKRYPRTIEKSVRKANNRRKEKRLEVKERKAKEKEQKMKELEMLNEMRKKEIDEKIKKLKNVAGIERLPFNDIDLDEDFNPDDYDRKMQEIFNNEYYEIDEGEEKPDCPDDIEDLKVENWDNYDPAKDNGDENDEPYCEDDDFNMDCDYDDSRTTKKSLQDELIENTRDKRKRRKRRSKFLQMLKKEKPVFNPDDKKTYEEYLDEYYKLDYEDIIGDVPCRFKYVETVPNDFGLSVEEILTAKNKELNQWASLKKATQIRPEHVEKSEVKMFQMKAKNQALKKKIFTSIYGELSEDKAEDVEKPEVKIISKNEFTKKSAKSKVENPVETVSKLVHVVKDEKVRSSNANTESTPECIEKVQKSIHKKEIVAKTDSDNVINKNNNLKHAKIKSNKNKIIKTKKAIKQKLSKNHMHLSSKSKKIRNKSRPSQSLTKPIKTAGISDERLRAFGINPKKYHKKLKYGNDMAKIKNTNKSVMSGAKKQKQQIIQNKKQKLKLKAFLDKSSIGTQ